MDLLFCVFICWFRIVTYYIIDASVYTLQSKWEEETNCYDILSKRSMCYWMGTNPTHSSAEKKEGTVRISRKASCFMACVSRKYIDNHFHVFYSEIICNISI